MAADVKPGSIWRRLVPLLAVLTALWVFGAFVAVREAVDLFRTRAIGANIGQPTDALIVALQAERRLSTSRLAGRDEQQRAALVAQRARTDQAAATLRRSAQDASVRLAAGAAGRERLDQLIHRLAALATTRTAVDAGRLGRDPAIAAYTEIVDTAFRVYGSSEFWSEPHLVQGNRALVALTRAREILAQEDSFVRGTLAAGPLTPADAVRLSQLVGGQRLLRSEAAATLPSGASATYRRVVDQASFAGLQALEDRLVATGGSGRALGVGVDVWSAAVDPVLAALRDVVLAAVRDGVASATPAAVATVARAGLVGGLGFMAMVALLIASAGAIRRAADRPAGIRDSAYSPATEPDSGGTPGAQTPANAGASALFLHLNKRNQVLLHRQLRILDAMQRRESDVEDLAELFRVDHLATRIRRNVEKSIILAGAPLGRRWQHPAPLVDVVRGAVAEVEHYQRVDVSSVEDAALRGVAIADVTHLLAELIENATAFSPADMTVWVSGRIRPDGYVILIKDRGPGLAEADLAAAHDLIADPSRSAAGAAGGLYAVGRLAQRQGVRVELRNAQRGGATALVLIPSALVVVGAADPEREPARST